MKIFIDCRYVRVDRHDGISRFTAELVSEVSTILPIELLINDRRQLRHLPDLPWHMISSPTNWREPFVALQVRRLHPDIVFSPMQTMGSWGRNYALILTLHDLIYYQNPTPPRDLPGFVKILWRLFHMAWWPQRLLLNRADHVVTVSHTSRHLIQRHRLTRRPITVIYNAPAQIPSKNAVASHSARKKTLVYMGSYMPYKNVETLVRAANQLPNYELHLMSRISDNDREYLESLVTKAQLVFHNGATDQDYYSVLAEATALVSASRDEGFGIPLVEAMSLGTPVVVSDIPVFREVAGKAGAYVRPDDADGFAHQIHILEDASTWETKSEIARNEAKRFSWAVSARTFVNLIKEIATER